MKEIKIFAFADEADSNIDGQIRAMRRNNLHGLEIRGVDGQNISDISIKKAKEVKEKLDANGLVTWAIGSPIGKIGINDDLSMHLDKFKHTLEIAHELNAKNIRIFSFYIPDGESADIYKNKVIESLGIMLNIASNTGVNLCHENEKGIYGDTYERCYELFKALPQLKGIFDPANFVQCGIDTMKAWDILNPYITYLHIKDALCDGPVVPAGMGNGNIEEIAKKYLLNGGKHFTIEPHLAVFEGLSGLEKENEASVIGNFQYESNDVAFDIACNTFKKLIGEN